MSMFNLHSFFILFIIYTETKSERWWSKITGYNKLDHNHGYAGVSRAACIDFYLCGKRNYTIHYKDDPPDKWSKKFFKL